MILLLLFSIVFCKFTKEQQKLITETLPLVINCSVPDTCTEKCENFTTSCISSVQPLCSKECEQVNDPISCHKHCESEGKQFIYFISSIF